MLVRSRKVLFLVGLVANAASATVLLIFLVRAYGAEHATTPVDLDRVYPVLWMTALGALAAILALFGKRLPRVLLFGAGLLSVITWYLAALAVSP